jgi:hypothetical protein
MGTLSRKLTVISVCLLFLGVVTENVKSDKMESKDNNIDKCKPEVWVKVDFARKELKKNVRRELPYTFQGKTV